MRFLKTLLVLSLIGGTAYGVKQINTADIANLAVTNAKIAASTIDLTAKVTGALPAGNGGTGQTTVALAFASFYKSVATTLGDLVYGGASGTPIRLAGDTSNTKKFLTGQSSAGVAAAPAWGTIASGDVPQIALGSSGAGGVGGTLPLGNGGTGQTTAQASFDGLSPCTTQGSVLYYNGTHWVCLTPGTSGNVLQTQGASANPQWAAAGTSNAGLACADAELGSASWTCGTSGTGGWAECTATVTTVTHTNTSGTTTCSAPATNLVGTKAASLAAGTYRVTFLGEVCGSGSGFSTAGTVYDGTTHGQVQGFYNINAGAAESCITQLVSYFTYGSTQTNITFSLSFRSSNQNILIANNAYAATGGTGTNAPASWIIERIY